MRDGGLLQRGACRHGALARGAALCGEAVDPLSRVALHRTSRSSSAPFPPSPNERLSWRSWSSGWTSSRRRRWPRAPHAARPAPPPPPPPPLPRPRPQGAWGRRRRRRPRALRGRRCQRASPRGNCRSVTPSPSWAGACGRAPARGFACVCVCVRARAHNCESVG
jgi:hypothetical protein